MSAELVATTHALRQACWRCGHDAILDAYAWLRAQYAAAEVRRRARGVASLVVCPDVVLVCKHISGGELVVTCWDRADERWQAWDVAALGEDIERTRARTKTHKRTARRVRRWRWDGDKGEAA